MRIKNLTIFDIVLSLLILIFALYLTSTKTFSRAEKITVTADDEIYEYDAKKNGTYTVQGFCGPTTFEIKNGRVRILDSSCPNKTCVHQGWSSPLVCLPNKVIITAESNNGEFDAFSE